jgi:galactoside 2-L-fucosyltransferase 1/2
MCFLCRATLKDMHARPDSHTYIMSSLTEIDHDCLTLLCRRLSVAVIASVMCVTFVIFNSSIKQRFTVEMSVVHRSQSTAPNIKVTFSTLPPENAARLRHRTVSMCTQNFDSRRIGNQLFNFASMVYVAWLTGRLVVMPQGQPQPWIDRWFAVDVCFIDNVTAELCPCSVINEQRSLTYDRRVKKSAMHYSSSARHKPILLCGWFQSWKYTRGVEDQLRKQLTPRSELLDSIIQFLSECQASRSRSQRYVTVGIHVRVGDIWDANKLRFGYTIPRRMYFEKTMRRAVDEVGRGANVQFIVTSDDINWSKETLNLTSIANDINITRTDVDVDIVYSIGHDAGFDLVLLSRCDAVIMTTGSFGWWGSWLANGTTYYFRNWPRKGSALYQTFTQGDFFPKHWIPVNGPYYML